MTSAFGHYWATFSKPDNVQVSSGFMRGNPKDFCPDDPDGFYTVVTPLYAASVASPAAPASPVVPVGWTLVPLKPTTEQRLAMAKADGEDGDRYRNMARAFLAAAPASPSVAQADQAVAEAKCDREADRARFPDPSFNRWLDEAITENGEFTVWHQIGDTCAAWHGWENRPFYTTPERAASAQALGEAAPLTEEEVDKIATQAFMDYMNDRNDDQDAAFAIAIQRAFAEKNGMTLAGGEGSHG